MTPRNARTNRPAARSSRSPLSARAVRSARAAQSGRIASRRDAASFPHANGASADGYRPAYTSGSQGSAANRAYACQAGASQYSRSNPAYSQAAKKMSRGKKIAVGVLAAFLVAVVGGGSAFALWVNSVNDQLKTGTKTEEELTALQDVLAPTKTFTEPFYVMLIGSDRRANDESMGARSDTNVVVRVDPTSNQLTMVSIPRDTKIDIDGYGTNKFNAAYNYGGAASTIREANQLLGIEISHYAEVNFEELVALVDSVGGVDVEVESRVNDPKAGDAVIEPGLQHLDGEAALTFARSRQYVDGDFTRTANQRKLIGALIDKVVTLPITDLPGVIQSAAQCVTTDLSVSDIVALAEQFKDEGDITIYSAMVPSTTGMIDEVSYVFTDKTALTEMMRIVEEGGDPSGITASASAYEGTSENDANSSNGSSSSSGSSSRNRSYDDDSDSGGSNDDSSGNKSPSNQGSSNEGGRDEGPGESGGSEENGGASSTETEAESGASE